MATKSVRKRLCGKNPERAGSGLLLGYARGRVGGRRGKLDAAKPREIAETMIARRKTGAGMARLQGVSQPTLSRIVAQRRRVEPWRFPAAEADHGLEGWLASVPDTRAARR